MTSPAIDGELSTDDATRAVASRDFGGIVRREPRAVLRPGSTDDVARIVRWANEQGVQVAAQGCRHSVYGRGQVDGGIVIDMSGRTAIGEIAGDTVMVDAGATWADVLAATLPVGLTPPVLTEYLHLSIGGTVAVGGVGGTTWRHGVQSDTVRELEVVTGDGRVLTCSRDENPQLFDAVRAGLGQVGIVTRATLTFQRAPQQVQRFQLTYPDLGTMLDDQRRIVREQRWDVLQGSVVPSPDGGWTYLVDGSAKSDTALAGLQDDRPQAQVTTLAFAEYVTRFDALEQYLRGTGQWAYPHPWLTMFVGDSAVQRAVEAEQRANTADDLGTPGRLLVSPIPRDAVRSPLVRLPDEDLGFAFNVMRFPTTDSSDVAAAMVQGNRETYERVRDAGGTLDPASALRMSKQDWRDHFGPQWSQLQAMKDVYDPRRVLTPGYELF